MNKVKLTNDQAKAIEKLKGGKFYINAYPVEYKVKHSFKGKLEALNSLTTDEFIRALYIGYEVEPEYKVGDWIKSKLGKGIGKIIDMNDTWYWTDFGLTVPKEDDVIRYVINKEIAKEKQHRLDGKRDKMLLELTDYERERLTVKLAEGNE